jgi:hypothetical protein
VTDYEYTVVQHYDGDRAPRRRYYQSEFELDKFMRNGGEFYKKYYKLEVFRREVGDWEPHN